MRLSKTDVAVMLLATVAGITARRTTLGYSWFIPFVVYHFFLFCNVFRIRRVAELVWAGIFLAHAALWFQRGQVNMALLFGLQTAVTVMLINYEIRQPSYHGIAARRLNPRIDEYLSGRV